MWLFKKKLYRFIFQIYSFIKAVVIIISVSSMNGIHVRRILDEIIKLQVNSKLQTFIINRTTKVVCLNESFVKNKTYKFRVYNYFL